LAKVSVHVHIFILRSALTAIISHRQRLGRIRKVTKKEATSHMKHWRLIRLV
jgi:hypothetical protein